MQSPVVLLTERLPREVEPPQGSSEVLLEVVHVPGSDCPGPQEQGVGGPVWCQERYSQAWLSYAISGSLWHKRAGVAIIWKLMTNESSAWTYLAWYEDLLGPDGSVPVHVGQHREHLLEHLGKYFITTK